MLKPLLINSGYGEMTICPFDESDIEARLVYLYDSPKYYLEKIGLNPDGFPPRKTMRLTLKAQCAESLKTGLFNRVVARLNGKCVAICMLDNANDQCPDIHFHIMTASLRGKGLGRIVFSAALTMLQGKFKFKKVCCQPCKYNKPMRKMLEKIGATYIKDYLHQSHPLAKVMTVSRYELLSDNPLSQ